MNELLGFAVLSGPLIAMITLLVAGIIATWILVRMQTTGRGKWIAAILTVLMVVLIPTWDEIAGRAYFRYLCRTDAGLKVYKKLDLDPEYSDAQFPDNPSVYRKLPMANRFPYGFESHEDLRGPVRIKYFREFIRDGKSGEELGAITTYAYGGGWFENTFSHRAGGGTCGFESGYWKALLDQIFKRV